MLRKKIIWRILKIGFAIVLFVFSIELLKEAFQQPGKNIIESILFTISDPFIGLFAGLLITAIIQSSSTTTSMAVVMVAAGNITLPDAIPILMGANIGTTLTSTIVSIAFITKPNEFQKALSVGVVHDFFNIITVAILFPLEIYYGFLSHLSFEIMSLIGGETNNNLKLTSQATIFHTKWLVETVNNSLIVIIIAFLMLLASIKLLVDLLKKLLIGRSNDRIKSYVFNNPFKSFIWGTLVTASVQSSTMTTSLAVPLVATGKISLTKITPYILGANIGTTITAFIAALFEPGAALSIAIAHLLFNLIGVIIFLPFSFARNALMAIANTFSHLVVRYRIVGLIYILMVFFLIPFALIHYNQSNP